MKYFLAIALIAAVASAGVVKPTAAVAEIQQIVQAINSPSTDPATAVVLEALLQDLLAAAGAPIVPGPVSVIEQPGSIDLSPIAVGPAFVDFEDAIVQPAPVAVAPVVAASAESNALVQIIVNVNQAAAAAAAPAPTPVGAAAVQEIVPEQVNIVEQPSLVSPIQVVEGVVEPVQVGTPVLPVVVDPVQVGTPVLPVVVDPVQVGTPVLPVVVDPVQVGTPILPAPVVVLPEELN